MTFSRMPAPTGGIGRSECQARFARYAGAAPGSGLRHWTRTLAALPGK